MPADLVAFLGVAIAIIVTPGPDTALTVKNALRGGRRGGTCTAAGVAAGQATWALLTSLGVAAILRASQPAFLALRVAGAAYLVWLGLQALVAAVRGRGADGHAAVRSQPLITGASAFRQGLLSNLANPKMVVFFTSLLPQFAPAGRTSSLPSLLGLGLLFSCLTLGWLAAYAAVAARLGDVLRTSRVRRWLDAATAVALLGLGVRLATEREIR
jgi:threonine/homoserine/homoserine lactone efflux protein